VRSTEHSDVRSLEATGSTQDGRQFYSIAILEVITVAMHDVSPISPTLRARTVKWGGAKIIHATPAFQMCRTLFLTPWTRTREGKSRKEAKSKMRRRIAREKFLFMYASSNQIGNILICTAVVGIEVPHKKARAAYLWHVSHPCAHWPRLYPCAQVYFPLPPCGPLSRR
jgi:hypothetical protein